MDKSLSQMTRELAVKLIVGSITCPTVDQAEAVIREAMQKAFEVAATAGALAGGKWAADVRLAIEAVASSLTEQETRP